jgi:hypothetical protein
LASVPLFRLLTQIVANGKTSPFLFLTTPEIDWPKLKNEVIQINKNDISGFFMIQYKGKTAKSP